jgi:UDP-glucose 4-epimerase
MPLNNFAGISMMNTKNLAVVTGGAGFIGSHVVDRLLADETPVMVIDDFSSGSRDNLATHENNPLLQIVQADIMDETAMYDLLAGADMVYHLACRNVRLSLRQPTIVHDINATGTFNVLKAAAKAGVGRFLYCSSSEVNGTADIVPMPEDYHFKPETIYGASKLAGEYYTGVFQCSGWLETVIVRPHNNYGPREHYYGNKGEVIPRFILWALAGRPPVIYGDGRQTRDFTYVSETADFLVRIMDAPQTAGKTLNLCRGEEVSVLEIARIIAELTGLHVPPIHAPGRPSDVLRLFGNPARLMQIMGEAPRISIRDGLQMTVDWFQKNVPLTEDLFASMQPRNWEQNDPEPWLLNRA